MKVCEETPTNQEASLELHPRLPIAFPVRGSLSVKTNKQNKETTETAED